MRVPGVALLVCCLLLSGATPASAFAISMVSRGPVTSLATSSTVTVDVFLDADAGLSQLQIQVLASSSSVLDYDGPASAAAARCAACVGPGTSGAQPSYILYTPAAGDDPATILYPLQTPYFTAWPSPPPGLEQVNLDYFEPSLGDASAGGTGIWIATLVFHVAQGFETETLSLNVPPNGFVVQGAIYPPLDVSLSPPIVLTGQLPEPTTAALFGLGILTCALVGRRRS